MVQDAKKKGKPAYCNMEVKHYLMLNSRGIALDDVCGRLASLRLLEFCLCGYPKALVHELHLGDIMQRKSIAETCR
jgi:hypothetical protein